MKIRVDSLTRGATRWTLLPAIAISAVLLGLPAAQAQDFNQQATSAERDDALNWGAATSFGHAYARAPYEFQRPPHLSKYRRH
jgi:hypothetical protein